jgi:hypothetical protein
MSTQKWESVTWEWLEREIIDSLLIAGKRPQKSGALASLLIERPESRASSALPAPKQTRKHTDA